MERDKIIKALECCSDDNSCYKGGCPYKSDEVNACTTKMSRDALALIKELTKENERLRKHEIAYDTPFSKQTMPNILSLEGDAAELYKQIEDKIKTDTVRKMQERLKEEFADDSIHGQSEIYCVADHIANEVLGEKK